MDLTSIVARIQSKYANSTGVSTATLVDMADILQKRIFRKLKKESYISYDLMTDQPTYPIAIKTTDIFQVEIGNSTTGGFDQYPLRKASDIVDECSKYHYFISDPSTGDWIGIYPLPTDLQDTMVIYYYEVPETLVATNLDMTPILDENYHMMLVYGVCKEVAEDYRDTDNANGFAIQYNALENELLGIVKHSDSTTVSNKMGW